MQRPLSRRCPTETRATLLARLGESSPEAWSEFERTYRALVRSFCHRLGLQAAEIDDVWQLVLMGLVSGMPSFRYDPGRGRFRSYLLSSVRRAVARQRRGARADCAPVEVFEDGTLEARADGLEELWEREWTDHHFRLAHANLRRTFERKSVAMFELLLAGQSVQEVAARHATTPQAVHKVKQRVRDRLRALVAEQIRREDRLAP